MKKLLQISIFVISIFLFSCTSKPDLNGYWRAYNPEHPDYYHSLHITDSATYFDSVVFGGIRNNEYEDSKLLLPSNDLQDWATNYRTVNDTIIFKNGNRWVKYSYCQERFIEDISGPLKVYIEPPVCKSDVEYLDYFSPKVAIIHIGRLKESFLLQTPDSLLYSGNYSIQLNENIGSKEDIPWFLDNNYENVALNMDKNTPQSIIDSIQSVLNYYNMDIKMQRTYMDLENMKLVIGNL